MAEDPRVVAEERATICRIARGKRGRPAAAGLDEERVASLIVPPFADHGIDVEALGGGEGALEDRVREARRSLDDEDAAPATLRRHEHATGVVLCHQLAR